MNTCQGFYNKTVSYGKGAEKKTYNCSLLLNDQNPGEDKGKKTWKADADYLVEETSEMGTFRHYDCLGSVKDGGNICKKCLEIPNMPSFKARIRLRQEKTKDRKRDLNCIRFLYLTNEEKMQVLRNKNEVIETQRSRLFFQKGKYLNALCRKQVGKFSEKGKLVLIILSNLPYILH